MNPIVCPRRPARFARRVVLFVCAAASSALLAGCWDDGGTTTPVAGFSVGGSITGLTASGLVLGNGSDTAAPAPGATSFALPSTSASGSAYDVVVTTQPTGETCSVSQGSGTVGQANVTSVQVSCSPTGFSVGGTITGLTTAGLVLANGSDTVRPAADATSFTFGQPVASGSAFAVSVQTQPADATCSVASGTGTIAAAAYTGVVVSCAANAHTLGGTISGLASDGLVLANGSDTVSPASGALTFTFASPVAEGGAYAVSVRTQPTGTTCSVGQGSGTMGPADVTSVQVTCSPNAYHVGGAISGLTAGGLILANGTDTVSPAANATAYSFAQPVAFGGTYSVSVQQQPPGLTCHVAGSYPATIGAGDVTTADVTCSASSGLVVVVGQEVCPSSGITTYTPGSGSAASVPDAQTMAFDANGTLYFTGLGAQFVGQVTPSGVVSTLAGDPQNHGIVDGTGANAGFGGVFGMASDRAGGVYVVDGNVIRRVTAGGVVTTIASQTSNGVGYTDGTGPAASFSGARGIATDAIGTAYIGDSSNNAVRKMTAGAVVTTLAGGSPGSPGYLDATGTAARFSAPTGVAVDAAGNVYVADTNNGVIRKITPAGVVTTLAGTAGQFGFADGTGAAARFGQIQKLVVAPGGGLYVLDSFYEAIRQVSATGVVSTLATSANLNPTGPITPPSIHLPPTVQGPGTLAVDASGALYLSINCAIERVGP